MSEIKLPKISIVTVVYNDKSYIEETIISCINQTYNDIEYIIIDGGSTDGTLKVIEKYESEINYFVSESDNGIYDAMNKGIDIATGTWINFMNAGDSFYNLNVIREIFSTQIDADLVYGKNFCKYSFFERVNSPLTLTQIKYGMIFSHQSMFVKTNLMKKYKFNLIYKISADYDFIYKIYRLGYNFHEKDIIISQVMAGGVSEINIINTHLERKDIAVNYEKGLDRLILNSIYNLNSLKIIFIKTVKSLLPDFILKKLTKIKYR